MNIPRSYAVPDRPRPAPNVDVKVASSRHSLDPETSRVLITVLTVSLLLRPVQVQSDFVFFSDDVGEILLKVDDLLLNFRPLPGGIHDRVLPQTFLQFSNDSPIVPPPHAKVFQPRFERRYFVTSLHLDWCRRK
jgi:hypothetical protein